MRRLFFVGNKRSGTSLVVELLNLHPQVFVTHESDVMWILYQSRRGLPERYRCYPHDAPRGMEATLAACRPMLESRLGGAIDRAALIEAFHEVQLHLMRNRTRLQPTYDKPDLAWIGDKKPVQHADPEIRSFCRELFPNARYLHLVRHPGSVVSSMQRAAAMWEDAHTPPYWREGASAILERWAIHEEWVDHAREHAGAAIHTLRFEDLLHDPVERMAEVLDFLGANMPNDLRDRVQAAIRPGGGHTTAEPALTYPARVRQLMDRHGYDIR